MLTLVTVIYGDARRYRVELFGSVLSALKLRESSDTRIVVYTDRPLDDFPLPVAQRIISPQEWQQWTRGSGITHLVKLHLLRQTVAETRGPVIYFDTDTLFQVPPEQLASHLSPTVALMHAAEGPIAGHDIWDNISEWLGEGRDVAGVSLSRDSVMYNSGIVGVVPEHEPALKRSIEIADALHAVDPIFSLDQFSTGSSLGHDAKIETCEDEVLHYWGWSRAFIRDELDSLWSEHGSAPLDELCTLLRPERYRNFPVINPVDKGIARFLEWRHGLDADCRFACIALLAAIRAGTRDPVNANRWFAVHVEFVTRHAGDGDMAGRLQAAIGKRYQNCSAWLDETNAAAIAP